MLPDDIGKEWFSVIRRLQSIAKSGGLSVVSINVLVDAEGKPIAWTNPVQTKIEPKNNASALLSMVLLPDLTTRHNGT